MVGWFWLENKGGPRNVWGGVWRISEGVVLCWDNFEFKVGKGLRRAAAVVKGLRTSLEEDAVIWKGRVMASFD
ncbi:hypothetical protein CK203_097806 [Vitis vinifera]|uniref:Uncharacterized protein n=1 Tax=Vitis vinifera TaxID=29760 RepID=A0A438D4Z7_VITVI|nr:hypothetical protein CK203_097806 [Vitis vinifera]